MKIRLSEFKSRILHGVEDLVDVYFSGTAMSDRLMNATVKIVVNQNADKFDDMLALFADKDGYIDTDLIVREYSKAFGMDKYVLDLRDFFDNESIKKVLPNKALAIKIEDVTKLFDDR
jgi:hypothetical protein